MIEQSLHLATFLLGFHLVSFFVGTHPLGLAFESDSPCSKISAFISGIKFRSALTFLGAHRHVIC
jgi:hypothetical protein